MINYPPFEKLLGKTVFFIGSPFQCLCALQAISDFGIKSFDIFIYDNIAGSEMLKRLLAEKKIEYKPLPQKKKLIQYFSCLFYKRRYSNVFLGNILDNVSYAVASTWIKKNGNLFFLDDGLQALAYFNEESSLDPLKRRKSAALYELLLRVKRVSNISLFTIFNVHDGRLSVLKNTMSIFKVSNGDTAKGVYIIGTNSGIQQFKSFSYEDYLVAALKRIRKEYSGEPIYYCPHRRDVNNKTLEVFCKDNNVNYFDTQISIEYDIIKKGIIPRCVIGFASNALFVLHSIFPDNQIFTIHYELVNDQNNEVAKTLESKLSSAGVPVLMLDL